MFKRKYFPPIFLKIMYCQGKVCYGKEKFKAVAVLMDIKPSGTSREEILQQSYTNSQGLQNPHARLTSIKLANYLP